MVTAKKRAKKKNLPGGTLVYLGDHPDVPARIIVLRKVNNEVQEIIIPREELKREDIIHPDNLWMHVSGIADVATLRRIFEALNIHKLTQEDIVSGIQRPKLEDYNHYLFITANHLCTPDENTVFPEQVSALLFADFVCTFEDGDEDLFRIAKKRLSARIMSQGATPDFIVYTLLDSLVDNLFSVLERLGEESESLQEAIIGEPNQQLLRRAFELKRYLLTVRRAVWPLREVLNTLQRGSHDSLKKESSLYFRDVYDHAVEVLDITENLREVTSSMVDIYLSTLSNNLNAVMKVLAVITTIFMPLTLITGIYGMNFDHMPELRSNYGYPVVLLIMISVASSMLYWFKRRKWI